MKFYIMDYTGHSTVEFTPEQKAEGKAMFAKLLADGKTAATRESGKADYQVIRDPAKISDETLFIPRYVAG